MSRINNQFFEVAKLGSIYEIKSVNEIDNNSADNFKLDCHVCVLIIRFSL